MLEGRGITIKGKKVITTEKGWVLSVTTFSGRPEKEYELGKVVVVHEREEGEEEGRRKERAGGTYLFLKHGVCGQEAGGCGKTWEGVGGECEVQVGVLRRPGKGKGSGLDCGATATIQSFSGEEVALLASRARRWEMTVILCTRIPLISSMGDRSPSNLVKIPFLLADPYAGSGQGRAWLAV